MNRIRRPGSICGIVALLIGASAAMGQTSTGSDTTTGGLDDSITTPPTTTDTSTGTTDSTGTTGGGSVVLTPRNSVANTPQYLGFKTRSKQFQFPSGSNLVAAELTTQPFRDAFLIPFIESVFEEIQAFIVKIAAASALGNALPGGSATSAPA